MSYIYKIENQINHKIYIGQTSRDPEVRFQEHCRDVKRFLNRPLYRAMNKYGCENFTMTLLEQCTPQEVQEREQFWVAQYNANKNGYNATKGGDGATLYDYEEIKKLLLQQLYVKDITKIIHCSPDVVYSVAKLYNITVPNPGVDNFISRSKQIAQYSTNNEFIQNFPSAAAAARWCYENKKCPSLNGGVRGHICSVANGKRKTAYGYIWKYI